MMIELHTINGAVELRPLERGDSDHYLLTITAAAEHLAVILSRNNLGMLADGLDRILDRSRFDKSALALLPPSCRVLAEPVIQQYQERVGRLIGLFARAVRIRDEVCVMFNITPATLLDVSRKPAPIPLIRSIIGKVLRDLGLTTPQAGQVLGLHHSTVAVGTQQLKRLLSRNKMVPVVVNGEWRTITLQNVFAIIREKLRAA